jgi:hypothetical protein
MVSEGTKMKTYARIVGNCAIDVTTTDNIEELFHPEVAEQFVEVPAGTVNGATTDGTVWTNPPEPEPAPMPPVIHPVVTPPQFRMLYKSPERIVIRANIASASPDPVLSDFFTELNDPQLREVDLNLASVQGAIQYSINFVAPKMTPPYTADDIARRIAQMMTGVLQ